MTLYYRNLSDADKDGGLTLEEFRVAIRLISLAKQGQDF